MISSPSASSPDDSSSSLKSSPPSDDAVRIKFLCSHGGKILPRPDGLLRYVGGDTRLVTFNKNIAFADLIQKLEKLFGSNLCLKYQLPNEDLDILISVTCDEDVQNLVEEYEKNETREGASRLRAFLFPRSVVSAKHVQCQTTEEEEGSKSPGENKGLNVSRALGVPAPVLSIPEVPEGGYSAYIPHSHYEVDDQHAPHQAAISPARSDRPYTPSGLQANYPRSQVSMIDCGGRSPALTTSALGSLSSHQPQLHQQQQQVQMWEMRKALEEGFQSDEKLNVESHRQTFLQDTVMTKPMVRISSKDSVIPHATDNGTAGTQAMLEQQQPKFQTVLRVDLPPETVDARLDSPVQGNNVRLRVPTEMQRIHNTSTTLEMQWGSAQRTAFEKHIDNQRNGVDPEGAFRKIDIHSDLDDTIHNHHFMKHDVSSLQQWRHGEYEYPKSSQSRHDPLHHLSRSHFQPMYWQLGDNNPEQKQYCATMSESIHMGSDTHRHVQPFDIHGPPAGVCTCCQHTTGPPNIWTHPDTFSSPRISSPLYRRAASGSPTSPQLHLDSAGPGRWPESVSPRMGQIMNVKSHMSSKHGIWAIQAPDNKSQQLSGQIFSDPVEGLQSGRQLEKGAMTNRDAVINQASYFDKMILVNQDGSVGQIHCNELMKRGCANSNQDAQASPGQQYGRLISNQESQCGRIQ